MAYTPVDFVADQLRAAAPDGEWVMTDHDRARELATMMVRAGIRDLSKLKLRRVEVTTKPAADWLAPTVDYALAFDYEGRNIGYIGEPDKPQNLPTLKGLLVAWSAAGKGNVNYEIQPRESGFVILPRWGSSSDTAKFRQALTIYASFIVSFVLPVSGIAAGQALGSAILGSYATAYPGLASVVGNVAIGAAMSGGDIEGAVKGALLSYAGGAVGAAVGGAVTSATDIEVIGKLAAAGTSAFVQGKDVERALLYSAVSQGAQWEPSPESERENAMDFNLTYGAQPSEMSAFDTGFGDAPSFSGIDNFQFDPAIFQTDSAFITDSAYVPPTSQFFTNSPFPVVDTSSPIPNVQQTAAADFEFSDVVKGVSQAAMAALQVLNVYRMVNTTARAVTPAGVVVAADNGMIQTRTADGRVISSRPPVNQPQSTLAGNVIVNNGDGTYTLVDQYGNTQRMRYPTTQGGMGGTAGFDFMEYAPLLLAGGVALFALTRK